MLFRSEAQISFPMKETHLCMENALYDFYSLFDTYCKDSLVRCAYLFVFLISTSQLVNKSRTRVFCMK